MEKEERRMEKGKVSSFEDLNVWKEAMRLAVDLYKILEKCRDFSLKDQMQRAAVSIPSNIAEGFERDTNKEFIRFLYIAKGSSAELRTQLYIVIESKTIEKKLGNDFIDRSKKISSMLYKLIKIRYEQFE